MSQVYFIKTYFINKNLFSLVYLILKAKRPAKDNIIRLLMAQYNNYGIKFFEYLFGENAASLFKNLRHTKAIEVISLALAGK